MSPIQIPADIERRLAAIQAEAIRKMAIVDALKPADRALVHEIGLSSFSRRADRRIAYVQAKAKAGVKGACRYTQRKRRASQIKGRA